MVYGFVVNWWRKLKSIFRAKEFEEGRRKGDLTRMREECEKVFHAYVEATAALIQKRGLPEPESHGER
jgi:hypothetical protein